MNDLQQLRERQAAVAAQRRAEQAALNSAGQAKKQLLAGLRTDEAKLATALEELRAKAARLADLVKKLETAKTQPYTGKSADFSAQKGRLTWPVNGKVRIGFGTTRHPDLGTLIESNGLEIAVPPQTPVKSVWAGRVLYAGPLKGFGNLMVIDHGEKYYTLYAHAARFTRKVGDLVAPERWSPSPVMKGAMPSTSKSAIAASRSILLNGWRRAEAWRFECLHGN